jgi:hypothetical protein
MQVREVEVKQLHELLSVMDPSEFGGIPLRVEHRDCPDFVIAAGNRRIGLEITDFADEELHRAERLRQRYLPNQLVSVTSLRDRRPKRPSNELKTELGDTLQGKWENAHDIIRHRLDKIVASVRRKRLRFQEPSFEKFEENWLLTANTNPRFGWRIADDIEDALRVELTHFPKVMGNEFQRIYIFHGETRLCVRAGTVVKCR